MTDCIDCDGTGINLKAPNHIEPSKVGLCKTCKGESESFDIPCLCLHGVDQDLECYWCDFDIAFDKFSKSSKDNWGYKIDCVKGLWAVCCGNEKDAIREARSYFGQYYSDGEYD